MPTYNAIRDSRSRKFSGQSHRMFRHLLNLGLAPFLQLEKDPERVGGNGAGEERKSDASMN